MRILLVDDHPITRAALSALLEGGYDPGTLPVLVAAALEGFRE